MTLHDDLTRTAALLTAGWPIRNLSRAKRAQERQMQTSKSDITSMIDASEDRFAAEIILCAATLRDIAGGSMAEIHIHDARIARGLSRVDGARISTFPPNEFRSTPFCTVSVPGVIAFTSELLS